MTMKSQNPLGRFVLCVRNDGSEDLEPRKVYQVLQDREANRDRLRTRRRADLDLAFLLEKEDVTEVAGRELDVGVGDPDPARSDPAGRRDPQNLKVYCIFPANLVSVGWKLRPRGTSCNQPWLKTRKTSLPGRRVQRTRLCQPRLVP